MFPSLKLSRWAFAASAIALTASLASCGGNTSNAPTGTSSPSAGTGTTTDTANKPASGGTVKISGTGATAPDPLYKRWISEYQKTDSSVQISYQGQGSGAGVKQFLAKTVDFGATDDPLKADDRTKYPKDRGANPIQIPTTGLFIVMAYNLDGVPSLKLSRDAYCGIVDGSITTWNDPKIAKDNAGVNLPSIPVTLVYRSDASGSTAIFTNHIKAACPNWTKGAGKSVEWGTGTGAKGNEGVSAQIQQTKGAIGYTEYSFAKAANLTSASLQNKSGTIVAPTPQAAAKALEGATLKDDLSVSIPDPAAKEAYPIVSLTYLLVYEQYADQGKADAIKKFVNWALKDGKAAATDLGYIPLPDEISGKVATQLNTIKVASK